ncbi:MAG: DUF58 domain-containing protein [Planctomycetes bacterium]|nr:DUF58 domain-containing protein [Planctomycetota bacterium]NUQ33806.1 DUF58 domain-containing protein [Planctomycetaceae bacterium]
MRFAPTKLAILFALTLVTLATGIVVLAFMGYETDWVVYVWAGAAGLFLLALFGDILLLPGKRTIIGVRRLPGEVGVGVPFEMTLTVANLTGRPQKVRVWDILPRSMNGPRDPVVLTLPPSARERVVREYRLVDRGAYTVEGSIVEVLGLLRLMRRMIRLEDRATVVAIPGIEVLTSNRLVLKAMLDADTGLARTRGVGRGGEFASLAPYVPGDPPSAVDWKGYARSGQLTVRRYEPERRRHIMLCCDAGRLMGGRVHGQRKVDLALQALTRLAAAALRRSDLVGLVIFDSEVRFMLPPRAGAGQLARIVRASLTVKSSYSETAFTPAFVALNHVLRRRSLVVVATDFDNEAQGWELQRNIEAVRKRHVVMVCGLRDPIYKETIAEPVETLEDGYRQLAALTLLDERQTIYEHIRKRGIHTLDAEPDELAEPMLNLYGRIIASGKL